MRFVVGSTVGRAGAIVVIVKPGFGSAIRGGGKFSLGMRDEPGMWAFDLAGREPGCEPGSAPHQARSSRLVRREGEMGLPRAWERER